MRIERFEDIEAWQLARELTRKGYGLTRNNKFAPDFGLKGQIQDVAGSSKGFRVQGSGLVKVNKKKQS